MKHLLLMYSLIGIVWASSAQEYEIDYGFDTDSLYNASLPQVTRFLTLGVSMDSYRGDLSSYQKWSSLFHGGVNFNKNKRFNSQIELGVGFITGENRFYKFPEDSDATPNIFFRTSIFSLSYELQVNLIKTQGFALYLSQGLGLIRFEAKGEDGQSLTDALDSRAENESYATNSIQLPTGIGARYVLKNGYAFGVHTGIFNVQTDYLDNISEWGTRAGNDNIWQVKFLFLAPLRKTHIRPIPPARKQERFYSH